MRVPIPGIGKIGVVKDIPVEELSLGAWTSAKNVRFHDGAARKQNGYAQVLGTPLMAPYQLFPVATSSTFFWVYCGLAKVAATDQTSHADITRTTGGDYSTDANVGWTGVDMEGILVLNNGGDVPQQWTPGLANDLTALTAWPSTYVAGAMRALKRYLVALNITKSGTNYPYMLKWSHAAPAGGVPTSWDHTDDTVDAAEFDLPAGGGFLVDAHSLRDGLAVYKEYETWLMQYVGGLDVFRLTRAFSSFGCFNKRCAAEFFSGKQLVFTGDDLVLHDGYQAQSVLESRGRDLIRGQVDTTHYRKSFLAINPVFKEVLVCFPEIGNTQPNKALVWDWVNQTIGLRDLPGAGHIEAGVVSAVDSTELWSGAVGDWSTDPAAWGDREFDPAQRALLMSDPVNTKLYLLDSTNKQDGSNMTAYVERINMGFPLKAEEPPDYETRKLVTGLWPRITGTAGGQVRVYLGSQEVVDGPVSWEAPETFTIGTSDFVDIQAEGRLHAIRFESDSDIEWKLHGYDVDVVSVGEH